MSVVYEYKTTFRNVLATLRSPEFLARLPGIDIHQNLLDRYVSRSFYKRCAIFRVCALDTKLVFVHQESISTDFTNHAKKILSVHVISTALVF